MAEEHKAAEHGEVLYTKDAGHDGVGGGHCREPEEAHGGREHIHGDWTQGGGQEDRNADRAGQVDEGKNFAFGDVLP